MERYPSARQGFWRGVKEQFRAPSALRAEELRRLEHEGVVRIEEGVTSRQTYTGFGAWKKEWQRSTLVLTRERVIVLIG